MVSLIPCSLWSSHVEPPPIKMVSSDQRTLFNMFVVSYKASSKLQTRLLMAFFSKWLFSCHSFMKTRFLNCRTRSCHVNRFSRLKLWVSVVPASLINSVSVQPISLDQRSASWCSGPASGSLGRPQQLFINLSKIVKNQLMFLNIL